eukprot:CCRYP_018964-RC/>CCRYP_018964-RC protein AED:0.47 eAED:1.00 QI:0/0/0/1/1/1/2/0/88
MKEYSKCNTLILDVRCSALKGVIFGSYAIDHFSSKDWIQLNAVSGIPERDHHMSTCQGGHQHVYRRRSVATQHHPKLFCECHKRWLNR